MTSIIPNKDKKEKQRKTKRWPIVFWLMIWQAASVFVGQEILLASPVSVIIKIHIKNKTNKTKKVYNKIKK